MTELVLGLSLGWAAGISPGPLSALVFTTALRRGFAAGVRVAIAPLLTDAPIVALGVVVAAAASPTVLAALGVAGGLYLLWLGAAEIQAAWRGKVEVEVLHAARDVGRGVLTNLLSPHPWLFWLTVGSPIVAVAWAREPLAAVGFLAGFFGLLVGTKVVLAYLVARGGHRLPERWQRRMAATGGALIVAAGIWLLATSLS